jgi:hypothetical protein
MKKCPTCQKTFDDNMRFCQTDGTPLVEAAEPSDPYKTMVASKDEIAAALGSSSPASSAPQQDEVLEIPSQSDKGSPKFQGGPSYSGTTDENEGQVMEIPPLVDSSPVSEPSLSPPSFGDISPPPSPFGDRAGETGGAGYQQTMPPIPSPFGEPESHSEGSGSRPEFGEAETMVNQPPPAFEPYQPASSPLEKASSAPEWTPPPAPEASWQNQPVGQDSPFQPPPAGAAVGQNKTLPIISLVLGILSLCCYVSPVTGIAALVTGYMGIKNIKKDPGQFGGRGLALAGMIIGALFALIGIAYWVFLLFFGGLSLLMNSIPN